MYVALVLLQTLVLPLTTGVIHLSIAGGNPLVVFGIWWAFWGIGTRLAVAGVSQLVHPARTAQGILGIADRSAEQVVHELGFANLSMGLAALGTLLVPRWGILLAAAGGIHLGLAGLRHVTKSGKGADESVATWTDLLVFVMVALGVIATVVD